MTNRREILILLGGGAVVSAAAIGGFVGTRTPSHALSPWQKAGDYEDPRLFALSYAILAPNPHNRQPWLVELVARDELRIFRDLEKNLPETDPFDRQLTIGMGAFLEAMSIALEKRGYAALTTLFPEGGENYIAQIKLVQKRGAEGKNDLFAAFKNRRSCKEPFAQTPLSSQHAQALAEFGTLYTDEAHVARLKQISWDAFKVEYQTHRTLKESVDLMRFGKSEINANPDGIDLGGPMMEALNIVGIITPEKLLDPASTAYQQGLDIYETMLFSTPAYILLKTPDNSRAQQIAVGRQWLRLNLMATHMGVSLHPISQALQEYPEMDSLYRQIHEDFAKPGETIQMFGRLGYGPRVPPSPRWSIEKKLL